MRAFYNDPRIKKKYLSRIRAHQKADNIIQGTGWKNGKGCAVGCTLEAYDHSRYEIELGIPVWLARVEDTIFEGLSEKEAMLWPARFLSSINVGADLEKVRIPFIVFILKSSIKSMRKAKFNAKEFPDVAKAIDGSIAAVKQMIDAHQNGRNLSAAESAARSAAWSAAESAARSAAWSAARSAAESAWSAAWSAARSAARSAESAARSAAYRWYAKKLLELLEAAR